ncbi:MAG: RNA polymerase sigma factor [Potamolinea sp.]
MLASGICQERETVYQVRSIHLKTDTKELLLLKSVSQGNSIAFWQLWRLHQDYLYRRCQNWMGGNHTEAQEALSRASLKAWDKLPDYAGKITNPKAWLTRLTHNLCVDMHRERNRGPKGMESMENISVTEDEEVASNIESPESAMLRREMCKYIDGAIEDLPPRLREPFILRCCQEMPYRDIAKQLDISEVNVRKRIQQARQILQKQLNKYLT